MPYVLADPQSKLNWQFDWSDWLAEGDSIVGHQWSISPAGPTLSDDQLATVVVGGLEFGMVYQLTEHVVTDQGLEDDRTIVIRCGET